MATMIRAASMGIFLSLCLFGAVGQSFASPPSAQGFHSRARLMTGGRDGDLWLAGIEIALDTGFKTYWRNPGESGLPPRFDWSRSENVASVDVRWPAPSRYEDAAGVAYVYASHVVLPVLVKPLDPGKPVKLELTAEYGICKDICIPAHAEMSAVLSGKGPDHAALKEALAKVPRVQALGAQEELSVDAVTPAPDGTGFSVVVRAPAGAKPVLFAEGPENWYLSTSEPDDQNRFTVSVDEKPKDAAGPHPVRLTVVAGDRAVETEVTLDANVQPR